MTNSMAASKPAKSFDDVVSSGVFRRSVRTGIALAVLTGTSWLSISQAQAQAAPPPNLVSACSGVSLPRSVVTDILAPVVDGVVTPLQNTVNPILGLVGAALPLVPPLSIDAAGLLSGAAAGQPITLQVLNINGAVVGPTDQCDSQADSFTLANPKGISIGGNRITGLGATGLEASAGELNSVAFGNSATTNANATNAIAIGPTAKVLAGGVGSVALGSNASVTAANSVAIGANSSATRGAVAGYTALGLAGLQNSVGEVSIGAAGAPRQLTNVAAGTAPTDAANIGQLTGVSAAVDALTDRAVQYDSTTRDRVTLAGAGGTTIGNLAPGVLSSTSMEAVNGSQLYATNQMVAGNTTLITNLNNTINNGGIGPVRYSNAATPTTPNGGTVTNNLTLVGATTAPVGLHNVAAGTIAAGSTDAVNGGQVFALQGQITAVTNNAVQYDSTDRSTVTLGGANGTTISNVAAGELSATSTQAVNGAQLNATNVNVANNTTAITNLGNTVTNLSTSVTNLGDQIANGGIGPVQYSNPATPTTPNGGVPTNDLTLVGAAPGAVALHNVANGAVAAGSTDAVNGGQIYGLSTTVANAVTYTTDAQGNRTNTVNLVGGNVAAPVTITNVGAGTLSNTSTEAVNGSQLYATNQNVATVTNTANTALTLSQNSVQYDDSRTSITLNSGGGSTTIHNVAAGISPTDAVNVAQLNSGINNAITVSNQYTDSRISALNFDLRNTRRDAAAGTAGSLAAAGLPQAYESGKGMIAIAMGVYRDQTAVAVGFSKAFNDGHTVVKMGGTWDSRSRAGASTGIGYQF